jgi:hypothetical protein
MFDAYLEVNTGSKISIKDDNRINLGNPLATFFIIYTKIDHMGDEVEEYLWFNQLESKTDKNIRLLARIYHGEDRDWLLSEYEEYISVWHYDPISEEEFRDFVVKLERMWTPIDEVIVIVKEIIRILPSMEETYWYAEFDTQPAFKALLSSLILARNTGDEKVRIQLV